MTYRPHKQQQVNSEPRVSFADKVNAAVTIELTPAQLADITADVLASIDLTIFLEAAGLNKITVGATAPSAPQIGDLWVDTN